MARNLMIMREDEWFLGADSNQNYPINYRYVICCVLLSFLSKSNYNKDEALDKLKTLKVAIDAPRSLQNTKFLDILVLEGGLGFVVVDQLDVIYPLVIYSKECPRSKGTSIERTASFSCSLEEVINNFEMVYSYLNGRNIDDWDQEFQEKLFVKAKFTDASSF